MSKTHDFNSETLLITGAAGSIGSELVLNFAAKAPKQLILVDISETGLHSLLDDCRNRFPQVAIVYFVESICNAHFLNYLFENFKITAIFHAAAYKHVSLMETNVCSAITTNIYGAQLLIEESIKHEVSRFVFISTDKAVAPINVMGRTKNVVENYLLAKQKQTKTTQLCVLRLCNVYGSSGSVVPVFKKRIAKNLPLEIRGNDVKRAFISVEAVIHIVNWIFSADNVEGIFIPKKVETFTIMEVAKQVLHQSEISSPENYIINFLPLSIFEKQEEALVAVTEMTVLIEDAPVTKIEKSEFLDFDLKNMQACIDAARSYQIEVLELLRTLSN